LRPFIIQEFDPFSPRTISSPTGTGPNLALQAGQIPIWLSFLPSLPHERPCSRAGPPSEACFFGAVFDTGCGHTLSATRRHLAGANVKLDKYVDAKRPLRSRSVHGATAVIDRLLGCLWIHSNLRPDVANGLSTVAVPLRTEGIACYRGIPERTATGSGPVEAFGPRIPVLGARTLALARIDVRLEYSAYRSPDQMARALFYTPKRTQARRRHKNG
jgi:hypothetical protein